MLIMYNMYRLFLVFYIQLTMTSNNVTCRNEVNAFVHNIAQGASKLHSLIKLDALGELVQWKQLNVSTILAKYCFKSVHKSAQRN